jgi:hypothetical protein
MSKISHDRFAEVGHLPLSLESFIADLEEVARARVGQVFTTEEIDKLERLYLVDLRAFVRIRLQHFPRNGEADSYRRLFYRRTLDYLEQHFMPIPQPLSFVVLPVGHVLMMDGGGVSRPREKSEKESSHRVAWAIELATALDPVFRPDKHFYASSPSKERGVFPYHVIVFPSYDRAAFISDGYGNATYLVPANGWEQYAKATKISDLQEAADDYRLDSTKPRITRFLMPVTEADWRARLTMEILPQVDQPSKRSRQKLKPDKFKNWLARIAAFRIEYGKWPSSGSGDEVEKELGEKIARWRNGWRNEQLIRLGVMLQNTNRLSAEEESAILALGIVLDVKSESEAEFQADLIAIQEFYKQHGRWPSRKSQDGKEKELGEKIAAWRQSWRNQQIKTKGGNLRKRVACLSREHEDAILAIGIVLDTQHAAEVKFQADLAAVQDFYKQHGRWPCEKSKDDLERKLGIRIATWRSGWRNEQLLAAGKKPKSTHRLSRPRAEAILRTSNILDKIFVL